MFTKNKHISLRTDGKCEVTILHEKKKKKTGLPKRQILTAR
jgi:hypothetical protein